MKQIILHIPHSSTIIPDYEGFNVSKNELDKEILKLTDWYTDELFYSEDDIIVKAEFSRIFCDVERFEDDIKEVMAQYGMGVLYEKSDDGKQIRKITKELREKILAEYYRVHHSKLNNAVENQLKNFGKALIIDCHSFPDIPFKRDLNKQKNRPDINIGTDSSHTSSELKDFTVNFFEKRGYTVGIDWPYSGTMVPLKLYKKKRNVNSIMIELNRKLYLNGLSKSCNFHSVKTIINDLNFELKNDYLQDNK